jgi:hypothetical protein
MKYLILMLLVIGCSPLRHYVKVANDPFRNSAERALLAKAAAEENLLTYSDTPRIVTSGTDSTDYNAVVDAYNELLDSLLAQQPLDTSFIIDTSRPVYTGVSKRDSLKIIKNFLRVYHPPAVVKTIVTEKKVHDPAAELVLQNRVEACRTENDNYVKKIAAAELKLKNRTTVMWWLIAVIGLGVGLATYKLLHKTQIV